MLRRGLRLVQPSRSLLQGKSQIQVRFCAEAAATSTDAISTQSTTIGTGSVHNSAGALAPGSSSSGSEGSASMKIPASSSSIHFPIPMVNPSSVPDFRRRFVPSQPSTGAGGEETEATRRLALKAGMQAEMKTQSMRENFSGVLRSFEEGLAREVSFDSEDHNLVLTACTRLPPGPRERALAARAFGFFVQAKTVPGEVFQKMVRVLEREDDWEGLARIYWMYKRVYTGVKHRELVLHPALRVLLKRATAKDSPLNLLRDGAMMRQLEVLYKEANDLADKGGVPLDASLVRELVPLLSKAGSSELLLEALRRMTAAKVTPTDWMCEDLLNHALWQADAKVLKVLLGWYLNNFQRSLEAGQIDRCLHVAAARGDEFVARLAFRLVALSGATPALEHYVCWTRACLLGFNVNGAIEALLEAQVQGHDLLASAFGPSLQTLIADTFKSTTVVLDGIYYALVDLRREKYRVPPMVLNALIIAAGRLNQLDRAFGTFQEYESLFGLKTDLHAHNALLTALSVAKYPQLAPMLAVVEDMEAAGTQPDNETFSLLLTTMADTGEMKSYDDILAYMRQLQRLPSPQALRRVVVRLAKDGQTERLEAALDLLREASGAATLPEYLVKRLEYLRMKSERSGRTRNAG